MGLGWNPQTTRDEPFRTGFGLASGIASVALAAGTMVQTDWLLATFAAGPAATYLLYSAVRVTLASRALPPQSVSRLAAGFSIGLGFWGVVLGFMVWEVFGFPWVLAASPAPLLVGLTVSAAFARRAKGQPRGRG